KKPLHGPNLCEGKRQARKVPSEETAGLGPGEGSREPVMVVRSARNVEKQKKKARRALPRKKATRLQGNTLAARRRLKKLAGKARSRQPQPQQREAGDPAKGRPEG